jgi:hypothetical protein
MSLLQSNNTFCSFSRNDGKVLYKNINLKTNESENQLYDLTNNELIDHSEIYITKEKEIYHKSYNLSLEDSNSRYLVWKQTPGDDWDWYPSNDILDKDLICIKDLFNEDSYNDIDSKIKYLTMKTEIMTNTFVISKKYGLTNDEMINITNIIEKTIEDFIINLNK